MEKRILQSICSVTICLVMIGFVSMVSCKPGGLDSGKIETRDSLFLGLKFGMSSEEFFSVSWDLNKKGKITNGSSNLSIRYKVTEFDYPANLNYYPDFEEDQLNFFPARVHYDNWSPWNKEFWSDKLIIEVKDLMEEWMGGKFSLEKEDTGKQYFLRKQGEVETTIKQVDDQYVRIEIRHYGYPKK